ncbi:protein HEAT INTOLERANT 4-like [Rhododendron vialii]|uniref:protein HEAT INTOLERANT 4-like n=1 Tax=Rhododendron vialii TaxID=182163 RepID=UPI00265EF128|nr:protein HEAT INTOLERANT 4-like [Rhododendron vialii]XP_058187775.1 protein HEAT INTOLERANT 4-like [Rhododendron vialii]
MRKGAKRKVSEKEEAIKSTEEEDTTTAKKDSSKSMQEKTTKTESSKAGGRRKKVKPSKPESEPEFFPDRRNLEDLWKQVFPVGTEWDQLDQVYQYKWNFSNLENAFEEGGELYGQKVYLFGSTEPQLVFFKNEGKVTCIPVVVAVVSPFPPSDKIGINSVQREAEEIVPMKQMKMDWVPYIPLEDRDSQVERLKSQIFILSCTQRRAGLRHLKLEHVKKFEYCLPYFYQPLQEDEFEQSTIVQIMFPAEPKPIICEFDWELDELEEFTDKLIEEEELSADQKDAFKDFVREKVGEGKKANREAREARKKALAEMSEETKTAFQNIKFYKFYPVPTPDSPDVSNVKSSFINRYYRKAHIVL